LTRGTHHYRIYFSGDSPLIRSAGENRQFNSSDQKKPMTTSAVNWNAIAAPMTRLFGQIFHRAGGGLQGT
jgi:hypothetical protein